MKNKKGKKDKPIIQEEMKRSKEGVSTAYVPVINASIIAPRANKVTSQAMRRKLLRLETLDSIGMNRWIRTVQVGDNMDMSFKITNALKAALLVMTAEPGCGSPPLLNPPGTVIPAVKVTVVINVATTKWVSAIFSDFSFIFTTFSVIISFSTLDTFVSSTPSVRTRGVG